jgi:hypothetical protein
VSPPTPKRGIAAFMADAARDDEPETAPQQAAVAVHAAAQAPAGRGAAVLTVAPVHRPAGGAWQRVLDARDSALTEPHAWAAYGLRLPVELDLALKRQLAAGRAATRSRQLHVCHYIKAALDVVPFGEDGEFDVTAARELGKAWQHAHGVGKTLTRGSGRRMHSDIADRLGTLYDRLQLEEHKVHVWQVAAQAVSLLLTELEDTGRGERTGPGGDDGRAMPAGPGTP